MEKLLTNTSHSSGNIWKDNKMKIFKLLLNFMKIVMSSISNTVGGPNSTA